MEMALQNIEKRKWRKKARIFKIERLFKLYCIVGFSKSRWNTLLAFLC